MTRRPSVRLAAATATALLLLTGAGLGVAGCANDPGQTQVITGTSVEQVPGELTPQKRGEVRRDVLRVAKPALETWLAQDYAGMAKYWNPRFVSTFKKYDTAYTDKGEKRVRSFKVQSMDVIEFNNTGNQALVDAWGYDTGYVINADGSKTMRSNPKRLQQIQFTVIKDKTTGKYMVENVIASNAIIQ